MKIRELSINNYLSFGDKGLNENNSIQLADFNLFIGSNNAGKSNALKSLEMLRDVFYSLNASRTNTLEDFLLATERTPNDFMDWFFAQDTTRNINFSFTLTIEKTDRSLAQLIDNHKPSQDANEPALWMLTLKKDYPKFLNIAGFIHLKGGKPLITLETISIPNDHKNFGRYPLFDRGKKITLVLTEEDGGRAKWQIANYVEEDEWWQNSIALRNRLSKFLNRLYNETINNLFINIGAIREVETSGNEIVESLSRLRDGEPRDINLHERVSDSIKGLVFESENVDMRFVYPEDKGKRKIKIQLEQLSLPLSSYGSGVEQIFVLASEIIRNGTNKIILIEEPEAHFHPELQRKFIRFLKDNQNIFNHQYLIATHSSLFINEFIKMNGNVYHVYTENNNPKYSQVEAFNKDDIPFLLSELGAKPADIFFANGILIVEGRIDREIYTDWAKKIGKSLQSIDLEVIDVTGAGNIRKYLESSVIQRTCFLRYALCDKNQEKTIKPQLDGIVPGTNILVLQKGDIEDYYPRRLVLAFAQEFGEIKGINVKDIPTEIKVGETVKTLNGLLGEKWWKPNLELKVLEEMKPEEIDEEIIEIITVIHDFIC